MDKPRITRTNKPLPFGELSPPEFERLCLWLVQREGYLRAEHLGESGSEQGRDIIAYKPTDAGEHLWYFQCKHHGKIGAAKFIAELKNHDELAARNPVDKPAGIAFVTSAALSAAAREQVSARCARHGYEAVFWARGELDALVNKSPDIVAEFFGLLPAIAAVHQYRIQPVERRGYGSSARDKMNEARLRHAAYYLKVISICDYIYLRGGENMMRGLAVFDLEWRNIEIGQRWVVSRLRNDEEACRIACEYPLAGAVSLNLRQHARERIAWMETALEAARLLKDRGGEGALLGNLGLAFSNLGELRRAIEFYEQDLIIAREIRDRCGEGATLSNLGLAYTRLGEPSRAIEFHEQQATIARETGDRRSEAQALGNLGMAYTALGELHRAIEYDEQALTITRKTGDRRAEGQALGNLGVAYSNLGETHHAIECYEQRLVIAREIGDRDGEGSVLNNLGTAYSSLGEPHRAIEYEEQALALTREIGDRDSEGIVLHNMSNTFYKLNRQEQAIAYMEAALAIFEEIESPHAATARQKLSRFRCKD
ncbi:MAG TPA: tetratricopeptide repeat protein [Pyrinomonadaceae bacterium]